MSDQITHQENDQIVSPEELRRVLRRQGEECYCAPPDWDPNTPWDVAGDCPLHGEIWHPALGTPHPDDDEETEYESQKTPVCETCGAEIDVWGCGTECSDPEVVAARKPQEE